MRRAVARAHLCTRLKHYRRAKLRLVWLKKASWCAADRTSNTTTFFMVHFLENTKILRENNVYFYLCISLVQWWKFYYIYIFFTQRATHLTDWKETWMMEQSFSDVLNYRLINLKHFASIFFLTQDNFMC